MESNQELLDELIRRKVYLLGYSKQLAKETLAYLQSTDPAIRELVLKLYAQGDSRTIARLRDAESRLYTIRSRAWKQAREHFYNQLEEMADLEEEAFREDVEASKEPKASAATTVSSALIAGATLGEIFQALEDSDQRRLSAQLRIGYLSDEGPYKTTRRVAGPRSIVSATLNNNIVSVASTSITSVEDTVHNVVLKANPSLFDLEIWISILDSVTTLGCRKLHKKKFPVNEGPRPGYHYHCRSERVPYRTTSGPVTADSYASWHIQQPREFQEYAGKEFSYQGLKPMKLTQIYKDRHK